MMRAGLHLILAVMLVVTPALSRGGHLTWQQIRKVSVKVEGATFVITDTYDRPLSEIHERIVKYWR